MQFLQHLDPKIKEESASWCSAALNYWAKECNLPLSGSLAARSWLKVGTKTLTPTRGNDIVILWRESPQSWKGHVGIYFHHNKEEVWILGGNQSDEVNISRFPISRVLEFRTLS